MNTQPQPEKSPLDAAATPVESFSLASGAVPKIIKFDSLARCGEEIWIENNGQIYRLRRTKQGKLILTK
jgi:hemin uptake protein HemP